MAWHTISVATKVLPYRIFSSIRSECRLLITRRWIFAAPYVSAYFIITFISLFSVQYFSEFLRCSNEATEGTRRQQFNMKFFPSSNFEMWKRERTYYTRAVNYACGFCEHFDCIRNPDRMAVREKCWAHMLRSTFNTPSLQSKQLTERRGEQRRQLQRFSQRFFPSVVQTKRTASANEIPK